MSKRISDKALHLAPSGIRKFFDVVAEMPDAISLGVGEPDFDTPYPVRKAGMKALQEGKTFYTSNAGLMELREEICRYTKEQIGVDYSPAQETLVTVGGSEAVDMSLRAILDPGDEVIIPQPCYVSYVPCVLLAGGVPVSIPLQEKNEFRLTPEELEAAITPKSKVLFLSFPNNPTGAIMEKKDLEALVPIIEKYDLLVISDEIYADLTYKGRHESIIALAGMRDRSILINGFSKGFAMTGWRLGYCQGPADIMAQIIKLHQYAIMCAPTTSQYAGVVALRDCQDAVEEMRTSYNQRRNYLMKTFREIGLPCFEPYGAFYAFPNIQEFGLTSDEFATKLLEEEKLAVVPGNAFGECGEGFIRISYAYSIEQLQEAMKRLGRFIDRLRKKRM